MTTRSGVCSILILVFLLSSCRDIGAVSPIDGLTITTDQNVYAWGQFQDRKLLSIRGEVRNTSLKTYVSKVGDAFGSPDYVWFARGSDGKVEKYDTVDTRWYERGELLGTLTEGPSRMRIESSRKYLIACSLGIDTADYRNATGSFRLRIDVYDLMDTGKIAPFHEYSNVFEIQ